MAVMVWFSSPQSAKYRSHLYFIYCPEQKRAWTVCLVQNVTSPCLVISLNWKSTAAILLQSAQWFLFCQRKGQSRGSSQWWCSYPLPLWPWRAACFMGCGCVYRGQEALSMHAPSWALDLRDESLLVSLDQIPASAWCPAGTRATHRAHGPVGLIGWCTWCRGGVSFISSIIHTVV